MLPKDERKLVLRKALGNNTSLTHSAILALCTYLKKNDQFETVDLSFLLMTLESSAAISNVLYFNGRITELNLSDCDLGDEGVGFVADALNHKKSIRRLILSSNSISVVGCEALAIALKQNYVTGDDGSIVFILELLDLSHNCIEPLGAKAIAEAFAESSTLTHLDVNRQVKGKKIGEIGCTELARLLKYPKSSLRVLKVARNNIGFEGCRHLAGALFMNSRLRELDIGGINYLSLAGALQMGSAVCYHANLEVLIVGEHKLPLMALRGKAQVLSVGESLRAPVELDLRLQGKPHTTYQGMHDEMAIVVMQLLTVDRKAAAGDCGIEDEDGDGVRSSSDGATSRGNSVLQKLWLDTAEISNIQELIGNSIKSEIDLSNRGYTSVDAIIIGGLIEGNKYLKKINLCGNKFAGTEGENFVAKALCKNTSLRLDKKAWTSRQMYTDGYKTLASLEGLSASGVYIEPQRLEGCFYRSLQIVSAVSFYVSLASDLYTLYIFGSEPETYTQAYVVICAVFTALPTVLVAYNTMRSLMFDDLKLALKETAIVVFQLSTYYQCVECVNISMETTHMLDYKFTQGVYRSMPNIGIQMYALFDVGVAEGKFNFWVLISVQLSIISIVIIFIMLYDRKEARRMAMSPLKNQPLLAIIIAQAYVCCGMGKDEVSILILTSLY